jgi:hypothetical protein
MRAERSLVAQPAASAMLAIPRINDDLPPMPAITLPFTIPAAAPLKQHFKINTFYPPGLEKIAVETISSGPCADRRGRRYPFVS